MPQENSHFETKLALRRHFMRTYHAKGPRRVFDAFQAGGALWHELRKEFKLDSYWGVDIERKKGRLKVDSARVLCQTGWRENILDLDAYGSPWTHWLGALKVADHSLTVFLTVGASDVRNSAFRHFISRAEFDVLGIPFKLPPMIQGALQPMTLPYMLGQALERFRVVECLEGLPSGSARYLGVRLELRG